MATSYYQQGANTFSVQQTIMEVVREFLESSTIHGLAFILSERPLVRFIWLGVVLTGFTGASVLIQQSFSSWASSPISTTIETLPITDLEFPNVTVCPPRNSFTSLIPDLVRSRNINFDEEKRKELSDYVPYAAYDAAYEAYKREFEEFLPGERKYISWYTGISMRTVPKFDTFALSVSSDRLKKYNFHTTAPNGSLQTPYFGQHFNVSLFDCRTEFDVYLYVPDYLTVGGKIVVDIEYDITDKEYAYFEIQSTETFDGNTHWVNHERETLDVVKKKAKVEFSVTGAR